VGKNRLSYKLMHECILVDTDSCTENISKHYEGIAFFKIKFWNTEKKDRLPVLKD